MEHSLIVALARRGHVPAPLLIRSDNGLVFTSRSHTVLVRGYGLKRKFIMEHVVNTGRKLSN